MELNEMQDRMLDNMKSRMSDDLLNQLKNAGAKEEAMGILERASFELTPDELDMISGGAEWSSKRRLLDIGR